MPAGEWAVQIAAVGFMAATTLSTAQGLAQEELFNTQVLVKQLLLDVRDTLIRVRTETEGGIELKEARLDLMTVLERDASGKLNLLVVSLGGGASSGTTQSLSVTLQPPMPGDPLEVSGASDALADAIVQAYDAVTFAGTSDPPLRLHELKATIRFVVGSEGSGGGGVDLSILPVSAELSGRISSSNVHEISLVFE